MRNFLRTTLLACVLSLCLVPPGSAGPLEDGEAAYERGDYATALRLWRPLAEQGDARMQIFLGGMYKRGDIVQQDYTEAAKWYGKAAEKGVAEAQFNLGSMYAEGLGVAKDFVEAHKWFNIAADGDYYETATEEMDKVAEEMTPAQIAEAQPLAREWKPKK